MTPKSKIWEPDNLTFDARSLFACQCTPQVFGLLNGIENAASSGRITYYKRMAGQLFDSEACLFVGRQALSNEVLEVLGQVLGHKDVVFVDLFDELFLAAARPRRFAM